jgi:hypothetical protein
VKLLLKRGRTAKSSMPGRLYVDGAYTCATLEDERRTTKVWGETDIHEGMLWIRDVPGFEYILIHQGNTEKDTAGCLLVGDKVVQSVGDYVLLRSRVAYRRLYQVVAKALLAGQPVTLTIEDAPC